MIFPKIPTRIHGRGDLNKVRGLVGYSKKLLGDLTTSMEFQGLKTLWKEWKTNDGSIIRCEVNHGLTNIYITCESVVVEEIFATFPKCFCSPCFTTGFILDAFRVTDYTSDRYYKWLYDVEICQEEKEYLLILSGLTTVTSDWNEFQIDDQVLVYASDVGDGQNLSDTTQTTACLMEDDAIIMISPFIAEDIFNDRWIEI